MFAITFIISYLVSTDVHDTHHVLKCDFEDYFRTRSKTFIFVCDAQNFPAPTYNNIVSITLLMNLHAQIVTLSGEDFWRFPIAITGYDDDCADYFWRWDDTLIENNITCAHGATSLIHKRQTYMCASTVGYIDSKFVILSSCHYKF